MTAFGGRDPQVGELFLFVFEELLTERFASEVDAFLERLALFFGYEGVVWHGERDFGDLVFSVLSFVEAEDYLS